MAYMTWLISIGFVAFLILGYKAIVHAEKRKNRK
jgi:hypothetical protein